jgi:hypothetical protein
MYANGSHIQVRTSMPDSDADADVEWDSPEDEAEAVAATEAYETDSGVVLYDAENPLAWIQADNARVLREMA